MGTWGNVATQAAKGGAGVKTAAQIRAENKASGAYGTGNWTGESGSWYEPGTASGNLAAKEPRSGVAAALGVANVDDATYNSYLLGRLGGAGSSNVGSGLAPKKTGTGFSARSGGGGGGGGAAVQPQMTQAQLDWIAGLLGAGAPQAQQAGPALAAPDYNAPQLTPFDSSMYDQLQASLGQAVQSDRAAATGAYGNLTSYLQQNYRNPYDQATYATQQTVPGSSQAAMQRMLASQGQSSGLADGAYRQGANADQAFGNLLGILGSNENQMQQSRLNNVQMDANQTQRALDMAQLQGNTGIGLQKGQAKNAWQQRADDRAYDAYNTNYSNQFQTALANWNRQNNVSDSNVANKNAYTNTELSALIGLLPSLISAGNLTLPDLAKLGLGGQATVNV